MASIIQRTLAEATGISPEEESEIWAKMHESPFRKLIQYELEKRQAVERSSLDTADSSNFVKQQGVVQGLTIAIGILARKDLKSSDRSR